MRMKEVGTRADAVTVIWLLSEFAATWKSVS
jgi:hypothetical protein